MLEPYFARAAYDVQQECERQMVRMAEYAYERTGSRNICIAGGVGLNGLSNARILQRTPFENIFIPPGCSDTGLALGLALWGYFQEVATTRKRSGQRLDAARLYRPSLPRRLDHAACSRIRHRVPPAAPE